jgi:hypothetical protein
MWEGMKHEPIHEKCRGCHQIIPEDRIEFMAIGSSPAICRFFPNPTWIWENRFCPEKSRHEEFVPGWFRLDKDDKKK